MVEPVNHLLADLNAEQRRAVVHPDGPLLVLAGPGTGKTRVITRRIAYRLASGATVPDRILAITFTNRAADEMKWRLHSLLGDDASLRIGTFHWICHAILRRHIHRLGYRRDFRLLGPGEARAAFRRAAAACGLTDLSSFANLISAVSSTKNGASREAAARRHRVAVATLEDVLQAYESELRRVHALDLDDLLRLAAKLLEDDLEARRICRDAYDEILVDEYQDVNPVQNQLLVCLAPGGRAVVAVGDEDQSIYGWREANVQSILRFSDLFRSAQMVKLEQTYRSTKHILRAARTLVAHNTLRIEKSLRTDNPAGERPICYVASDESQEAEWVAKEIMSLSEQEKRPWTDFAVLYRLNAQSRSIEDALVRYGIPYHIRAGHRFYERLEIRLAVAYLRLALDRTDDDATVCLLEHVRGIGAKRLEAVRGVAKERRRPLVEALDSPSLLAPWPSHAQSGMQSLRGRIATMQEHRQASLVDVVTRAIECTLAQASEDSRVELEEATDNLGELRSLAREFVAHKGSLRTFVDRLAGGGEGRSESVGVSCMSLHAAKGTEYGVVFIIGMEEGLLPHRHAIDDLDSVEEERRLCYVGMTRARQHLRLSYAHSRLLAGQAMIGQVSRFVAEIGRNNITVCMSPGLTAKPRLLSVEPGQRVVHSRWREGTVLKVEGRGRDTTATILFDEAGQQRLQLRHAPLWLAPPGGDHVLAG